LLGRNAKERLAEVKRGLVSILEMLGGRPGEIRAYAPARAAASSPVRRKTAVKSAKPAAKPAKKRVSRR
jgi:hypothetical protein